MEKIEHQRFDTDSPVTVTKKSTNDVTMVIQRQPKIPITAPQSDNGEKMAPIVLAPKQSISIDVNSLDDALELDYDEDDLDYRDSTPNTIRSQVNEVKICLDDDDDEDEGEMREI